MLRNLKHMIGYMLLGEHYSGEDNLDNNGKLIGIGPSEDDEPEDDELDEDELDENAVVKQTWTAAEHHAVAQRYSAAVAAEAIAWRDRIIPSADMPRDEPEHGPRRCDYCGCGWKYDVYGMPAERCTHCGAPAPRDLKRIPSRIPIEESPLIRSQRKSPIVCDSGPEDWGSST